MKRQPKWRYHHGVPELRDAPAFYQAYSDRVDALIEEIETALGMAEIDVESPSFIDIAAAEGYITNHLHMLGAGEIDAIDISAGNIDRMWLIRAFKGIDPGRIGRLDLDNVNWARALDSYDVTFALGIV